jgi:anti-sigma B factor antagonist
MKLSSKETDGVTVVNLEGSILGGPDATELNDYLHRLVEKRRKKIVLDLGKVHTMNSSGLSMLITAVTTVRSAGGALKVAGASEKIENLFVITKLSTVIELQPSVREAVASFTD